MATKAARWHHRPPHRLAGVVGRADATSTSSPWAATSRPWPTSTSTARASGGCWRPGPATPTARAARGGRSHSTREQPRHRHRGRERRRRRGVARRDAGVLRRRRGRPGQPLQHRHRPRTGPPRVGAGPQGRPGRPQPLWRDQRREELGHGHLPAAVAAKRGGPARPRPPGSSSPTCTTTGATPTSCSRRRLVVDRPEGDGRSGTTWPVLAEANGGATRVLHPGDVLTIPAASRPPEPRSRGGDGAVPPSRATPRRARPGPVVTAWQEALDRPRRHLRQRRPTTTATTARAWRRPSSSCSSRGAGPTPTARRAATPGGSSSAAPSHGRCRITSRPVPRPMSDVLGQPSGRCHRYGATSSCTRSGPHEPARTARPAAGRRAAASRSPTGARCRPPA